MIARCAGRRAQLFGGCSPHLRRRPAWPCTGRPVARDSASRTAGSEVDTSCAPCACGPVGKKSWQSQPYLPPGSSLPGTMCSYDALGRTIAVLLADGASHTTYVYQGNFTTVTDPAGNWKQYATDALGNPVMVLEPDPTQNPVVGPPTPAHVSSYQRAQRHSAHHLHLRSVQPFDAGEHAAQHGQRHENADADLYL